MVRGSKDFPPLVKSFHSYRLVDSRSQTLVGIKHIFETLVGESVAWKVERSKEFLNIAQWCSLWHLQARERTTMHTVKPFRGNTSPGPLASLCRLYVTKLLHELFSHSVAGSNSKQFQKYSKPAWETICTCELALVVDRSPNPILPASSDFVIDCLHPFKIHFLKANLQCDSIRIGAS